MAYTFKCVGGKCDGQIVRLDHRPRVGYAVRVNLIKEFDLTMEFDPNQASKSVVMNCAIYIVDHFKYSHGHGDITEIWFLRPENFTMLDAIQFQFNKV